MLCRRSVCTDEDGQGEQTEVDPNCFMNSANNYPSSLHKEWPVTFFAKTSFGKKTKNPNSLSLQDQAIIKNRRT